MCSMNSSYSIMAFRFRITFCLLWNPWSSFPGGSDALNRASPNSPQQIYSRVMELPGPWNPHRHFWSTPLGEHKDRPKHSPLWTVIRTEENANTAYRRATDYRSWAFQAWLIHGRFSLREWRWPLLLLPPVWFHLLPGCKVNIQVLNIP